MIKLIATGVLVLVMTLGGVFAAVKFGQPPRMITRSMRRRRRNMCRAIS